MRCRAGRGSVRRWVQRGDGDSEKRQAQSERRRLQEGPEAG